MGTRFAYHPGNSVARVFYLCKEIVRHADSKRVEMQEVVLTAHEISGVAVSLKKVILLTCLDAASLIFLMLVY